ncbi:MAG: hypothetical protein P8126_07435 [Gammaproteobacteria bacterium]|jgi:hypothetical protein
MNDNLLLLILLVWFIVIVTWAILPFIFMGTNRRLDRLVSELRENNSLHAETNNALGKIYTQLGKFKDSA